VPQQDEQPTISNVSSLARSRSYVPAAGMSGNGSSAIRQSSRTPFGQAHYGLRMRDAFALDSAPCHFFDRSWRSAAASDICSAKSFFSLAFFSRWPRRHLCRGNWPSSSTALLPRPRACAPDPPSSPRTRHFPRRAGIQRAQPCFSKQL
jgi:hypothetical protein